MGHVNAILDMTREKTEEPEDIKQKLSEVNPDAKTVKIVNIELIGKLHVTKGSGEETKQI